MAITRVGAASAADTGAGDAVLTLTMPTGVAAGDGALLAFTCASSAATVTITSNGLSVDPVAVGTGVASFAGHSSRLWALNNLAAADSGKILTFTASTNLKMSLAVVVYRGVSTSNIVDAQASKTSTVATTTPTNPAVTTVAANAGVTSWWFPTRGNSTPQIVTVTKPSGETIDTQAFTSELSGANGVFASHDSFGTGVATNFRTWSAGSTVPAVTYTLDQSAVYSAWTVTLVPGSTGPTADAGAAQTVTAGAVVTLSGSDSPGAGTTITARAWTALTYPGTTAPTLTGAATATATFTAATAGEYTFRYRVTDSTGAFTDATTTVYATAAEARPTGTVSAGVWTAGGGAASLHAALADESDATFALAVNPNASSFTVNLAPSPVGAKTVTYRLQVDPAATGATGTVLVEYLNGNGAVVASWNENITTTAATFTHALTDTQNANLTDPNNHQLRFTGTAT